MNLQKHDNYVPHSPPSPILTSSSGLEERAVNALKIYGDTFVPNAFRILIHAIIHQERKVRAHYAKACPIEGYEPAWDPPVTALQSTSTSTSTPMSSISFNMTPTPTPFHTATRANSMERVEPMTPSSLASPKIPKSASPSGKGDNCTVKKLIQPPSNMPIEYHLCACHTVLPILARDDSERTKLRHKVGRFVNEVLRSSTNGWWRGGGHGLGLRRIWFGELRQNINYILDTGKLDGMQLSMESVALGKEMLDAFAESRYQVWFELPVKEVKPAKKRAWKKRG